MDNKILEVPEFEDYLRRNYGYTYTKSQLRMALWEYMRTYNVTIEITIIK